MIEANGKIFRLLDSFAIASGTPLESAGQPRWIETDTADREILKSFAKTAVRKYSPSIAVGRFDRGIDSLWILIGFNQEDESTYCYPTEIGGGILTCGLAEMLPRPTASNELMRQVVDASDKRDADYNGHSVIQIRSLFPRMTAYYGIQIPEEETDRIFFEFVLVESQYTGSWISNRLRNELHNLHRLALIEIPYYQLSKAIFDFDPASIFMGLYRCLEMLYSFSAADRLRSNLSIAADWQVVAASLEDQIGWRPIEASSLSGLVAMGGEADLSTIVAATSNVFPPAQEKALSDQACAAIYKLRNSIVHYRPAQALVDHALIEWDELCCATANLVAYVYSEIFETL